MLLAFAGLSGAGKTTAVTLLANKGRGQAYYAGDLLRRTLIERGLPLTPENERKVRSELREQFGMNVFAAKAVPEIEEQLKSGHVLLDAIYNPEERYLYLAKFPEQLVVLAIAADQSIRATRLVNRPERPMCHDELVRRDEFELEKLRLGDVLDASDETVVNEGSLGEFEQALDAVVSRFDR